MIAAQQTSQNGMTEIPGYPKYKIDRTGTVISYWDKIPEVCKPRISTGGYVKYYLKTEKDKGRQVFHHVMMATTFLPNPNNHPVVDHINRIKSDNRLENLRWASYSRNASNKEHPLDSTTKERYINYRPLDNVKLPYRLGIHRKIFYLDAYYPTLEDAKKARTVIIALLEDMENPIKS